jgi:hypothetical protein
MHLTFAMSAIYLQFVDKDAGDKSESAMYIRVHTPLHRQANGRPIAIVSVVDNVLAKALMHDGKLDQMQEVQRFKSIMMEHHWKVRVPPRHDQTCTCIVLYVQ